MSYITFLTALLFHNLRNVVNLSHEFAKQLVLSAQTVIAFPTGRIMLNPTRLASDDKIYERDAIEAYMANDPPKTPRGEEELDDKTLMDSKSIKRKIAQYLKENPAYQAYQYQPTASAEVNTVLQNKITGLEKQVAVLQAQFKALKPLFMQMKEQIAQQEKVIKEQSQTIGKLQSQVAKNDAVETLQRQSNQLTEEVSQHKDLIKKLQLSDNQLNMEFEKIQTQNDTLTASSSRLEINIKDNDSGIVANRDTIKELENRFGLFKQKITGQIPNKERIKSLSQEVYDSQPEVNILCERAFRSSDGPADYGYHTVKGHFMKYSFPAPPGYSAPRLSAPAPPGYSASRFSAPAPPGYSAPPPARP